MSKFLAYFLATSFAILCISLFTWSLVAYTVGVPVLDDFGRINFPTLYKALPTVADKVQYLVSRDGLMEHRIGVTRLILLLQYTLTGQINLFAFTWIGNSSVYVLAAFLLLVFGWTRRSYVYFLPVIFLIFQTQLLPFGILWSCSSVLYVPVSLLSMGVFYLLLSNPNQHTGRFVAGLVLMLAGLYTFSNGLFVLPIALMLLLVQRQWRFAIILLVYEIGIMTAYMWGYHKSDATQSPSIHMIGMYITNFFAFVGGLFDIGISPHIGALLFVPVCAGLAITFIFLLLFLRTLYALWPAKLRFLSRWPIFNVQDAQTRRLDLFLISLFLYLFMTALVLAFFRVSDTGDTDTIFRSRYKINSVLFLVAAYLSTLSLWPKTGNRAGLIRYAALAWALGTFALNLYSYYWTAVPIQYDRDRYNHAAFNYQHNGIWGMFPEIMKFERETSHITDVALKNHTYQIPRFYYTPLENLILYGKGRQQPIPVTIKQSADEFILTNQTVAPIRSTTDGQCIVLRNQQHTYLFALQPHPSGRRAFVKTGNVFGDGFTCHVPKPIVEAGKYQVGLLRYVDQQATLSWLPITITAS